MTDLADRANDQFDKILQSNIASVIATTTPNNITDCIDCDKPIGNKRKTAMPSAVRCIACQTNWEQKR